MRKKEKTYTIYFKNGELLDEKIVKDIAKASELYQDGAIIEAADIINDIGYAIRLFLEWNEEVYK